MAKKKKKLSHEELAAAILKDISSPSDMPQKLILPNVHISIEKMTHPQRIILSGGVIKPGANTFVESLVSSFVEWRIPNKYFTSGHFIGELEFEENVFKSAEIQLV